MYCLTWGSAQRASVSLDKAAASSILELAAELIGLISREWTKLRRIENTALALDLFANLQLIASQHGIFRLRRAERRLGLCLGPLC